MSSLKLLEFKYNMKKLPSKAFSRAFSSNSRIPSSLSRRFVPNGDEMKEVFHKMDKDGDGKISVKDLEQVLTPLRGEDMAEEAGKMMEAADSDHDGCMDFKEFMDVQKRGGGIKALEIQNAFLMCDLDRDGRINAKDLEEVLRRLGMERSPEDCERMVRSVDRDGEGQVDMDDFMFMMTKTMNPWSGENY